MSLSSGDSSRVRAGERVPDFFIVGHPKSGTTAMWEMLRQHPQIYMPVHKEPHYFSTDIVCMDRSWREYLTLFEEATPEQRLGEASVWYLSSHVAAQAIFKVSPDARIIALFREPASFLRSLHLQLIEIHVEREPDLRRALALESQRRGDLRYAKGYPRTLLYSEHVRYAEQIRRYSDLFPRENVLVLIYDDFLRNNDSTLRTVLSFLDVDERAQLSHIEANPTVRVRSVRLYAAIRAMTMGSNGPARAIKRSVMSVTTEASRERLLEFMRRRAISTAPAPADESLTQEIKRRFAPEVEALGAYLGRDLVTEWGYKALV